MVICVSLSSICVLFEVLELLGLLVEDVWEIDYEDEFEFEIAYFLEKLVVIHLPTNFHQYLAKSEVLGGLLINLLFEVEWAFIQ